MRVILKGGAWKNTEDEILKAAVMKYGKNQWARVSSLLGRKTAKQCKARWFEWLDPSIKKTDWSKDEDEKLLHLAKLMPTQWRTIAPIVGRTPAQCLERYQRLLDEAEQAEGEAGQLGLTGSQGGETSAAVTDPSGRGSYMHGIQPTPETRPAIPDAVDMDADEKEMLSEARARLANTQGKKAKRKARERQLEEARRLASLQKSRELKAAGIEVRKKKKTNDMDYNADIPFEKRPMAGFFDTREELNRVNDLDFLRKRLNQIDGRKKRDYFDEQAKQRAKRTKQSKNGDGDDEEGITFVPSSTNAKLLKIQEAEQIAQRRKLQLPTPQVTQTELDEIIKLGQASETARDLVSDGPNAASNSLLNEYQSVPKFTDVRTPATEDTVMVEARNLRRLAASQTPLLGRDSDEMSAEETGTGYDGIQPRSSIVQTPNPLLTPLRAGHASVAAGRTS
ncbi:hypothetical protein BJ085DRAFT_29293, partial [Dimargaris cristalligena]